ncbi:C2H2 finger domain-containing protein [Colletotrichum higginsianum IMI 349063]|uniref:C2H2 finger domain-containing protein n=4 Tax=Colletotrichum destructivum species complex TaxID=2707350 RepID=A0A1B7XU56_COLHI|nr:C2H2 finger domain-containing protein [Colletotrichum higginsianum IMI 349063]OBR03280.1 C2H2 finger domain-containing protein [Colletotrichum higginsianum IMI 349063]
MEATSRYRDPAGLPSILIDSSNPRTSDRSDPFNMYSSSVALSIPGSDRITNAAPPPLPPPPFPFGQGSMHHSHEPRQYHRDPSSYSPREHTYHDSIGSLDDRPDYKRAAYRHERDEGYASMGSASASTRSECSLPSISAGFGSHHDRFQFQSSADALTDMKKKLDPSKTFDNKPAISLLSASSASALDPLRRLSGDQRMPPHLGHATLPLHLKTSNLAESPDRFTQTPLSALSPSPGSFHLGHDHRPPRSVSDLDRSPPMRSRRNNSDDASSYGYDAEDMEIEETNSMKRLRIEDPMRAHYDGVGTKRRASADPDDSVPLGFTTQGDLLRRRDGNQRASPTPRLSVIPQGSVSSISSGGRAGSYSSNLSLLTGSIASISPSYGRVSPGGLSPGGISPGGTDPSCSSPYSASMSLNPSPRGSLSRAPHQRTISESRPLASPRKLAEVSKPVGTKISGFFMCDCCPKKPKKFETAEELAAHEAEKQYECSFCGNRFKNKNEAERHQNSLHVRRHSWSCSALSHYDRAFHDSTNRPGEADTCGYCGEEFPRNGRGPGASAPRHATDQDWEERIRHLQEVHKFRECNSSKKFFRADHFRQHLKHSHAGTSGKWTNMLENACMLDEDPTPR